MAGIGPHGSTTRDPPGNGDPAPDPTSDRGCTVLIRSDPFTMLDRLLSQVQSGTPTGNGGPRELAMPLDAFRTKDGYIVEFDVPGVATEAIDVTVERSS